MHSVIGLVPAAGRARRLELERGSKEVLRVASEAGEMRPVIEFMLDGLGSAGVKRAVVVLREGKEDIPATLARRRRPEWPELAYIVTPGTDSIPETVRFAAPLLEGRSTILGFPDVRFQPFDAPTRLLAAHKRSGADVTLGLFPSERPDKTDMVEIVEDEAVLDQAVPVSGFRVKPGPCGLLYTWIMAAWTLRFTEFLDHFLGDEDPGRQGALAELQMSEVFGGAIQAGLAVNGLRFATGQFIDIGTPEDLERAATEAASLKSRSTNAPEGGSC